MAERVRIQSGICSVHETGCLRSSDLVLSPGGFLELLAFSLCCNPEEVGFNTSGEAFQQQDR